MDFDISEDQRLLQDSVSRLLGDTYAFEQRKQHIQLPEGWSREVWNSYAELGLLGLPFAEDLGGYGGTAIDTMLVMEQIGRTLALEPYLACVVVAGAALKAAGDTEVLPQIISGERIVVLAHAERAARHVVGHVTATAKQQGGAWVIDGEKTLVPQGDTADAFLVSARTDAGITLFLVDAHATGLTRQGYTIQDSQRAAELRLAGVKAERVIGAIGGGLPLVEAAYDAGIAAVCAEAVGAMDAMVRITVDYIKQRQQFGKAIGTNQALQHRAVEMLVYTEQARSMAIYACVMAEEKDLAERRRALSAAKVQIGRSLRFVGQQAIQMHGGIGMTEEYLVGHYHRRGTMIEQSFGDTAHHIGQLIAARSLLDAA